MVRVVHAVPDADPTLWATTVDTLTSVSESSRATRTLIAPTLPGTINGGDLILRLRFMDESAAHMTARTLHDIASASSVVELMHGADYRSTDSQPSSTNGRRRLATVYRALLVRVSPDADPAHLRRFEHDTLSMPNYISSIVRWRLSPVSEAFGPTEWTHVWEQEFTDVDGLLGEYMDHPVHWGIVDRWFDPECPEMIIRDRVCHTFCGIDTPLLDSATTTDWHTSLAEPCQSVVRQG
ncbi:Dabb family protein [Rhodococcus sp. P1Y]|nr:Dabb family protein [Rhodococcus sp. P1Y]